MLVRLARAEANLAGGTDSRGHAPEADWPTLTPCARMDALGDRGATQLAGCGAPGPPGLRAVISLSLTGWSWQGAGEETARLWDRLGCRYDAALVLQDAPKSGGCARR